MIGLDNQLDIIYNYCLPNVFVPDTVPSTLHKLFLHLIDVVKKMELSSLWR